MRYEKAESCTKPLFYYFSLGAPGKLAALLCDLSSRYCRGFEHVRNLMQLGFDLGKTEVNMAHQQEPNCIGIASSLHLELNLDLKVQQKSHQKSSLVL